MNKQPLVSREGFDYVFKVISSGRVSKTNIQQLLGLKNDGINSKASGKDLQVQGILELIKTFGEYEKLVDIGCGKGTLTHRLASIFPDSEVLGLDLDPRVIETARKRYQEIKNLRFERGDCFDYHLKTRALILLLHGCGALAERVIDIGIETKSDIICVPCCYSKIMQERRISLPRSKDLQARKGVYGMVLKRATAYEGLKARVNSFESVMREAYRFLVNLDRLLYMEEHGYEVRFMQVFPESITLEDGKQHSQSSLNKAIIGKFNQ